jgi:hypothetical protein
MANWSPNFSVLGEIPGVFREAQQRAARERTLANLGQGDFDYNQAARALLSAGDMQGAMTLAQLGRGDRDFEFRRQESQRAQSNADRSFDLQKRQAEDAARGYEYREVETPNGKELVRIHKQTGQAERVNVNGGAESTPNNPYMTGGAMNESQSKDALYASRMMRSESVLRAGNADAALASPGQPGGGIVQNGNLVPGPGSYGIENSGANPLNRVRDYWSNKSGFNLRGAEHQKFDQAKRDFVNATLRRESGAVISDSEFDNANKQYFPMPGDTPEVIAQKRQNRMEAIRGIGAGAGKGYRPDRAFDAQGNIVANPATQRQEAPKTGMPSVGEVRDGYRYKGGNPADPSSWVAVK